MKKSVNCRYINMYNDKEIDGYIDNGMTLIVANQKNAIDATRYRGYYYPIYDKKYNRVVYGIPK